MSLIHRRKSAIFNQQSSNLDLSSTYKMKVESVIDAYKSKLMFNNSSVITKKKQGVEKLSLNQAKKLERLHQCIASGPRVNSSKLPNTSLENKIKSNKNPIQLRKKSLHFLLQGYHRNSEANLQNQKNTINPQRLELFRKGKYYRSSQRAQGAGVRKVPQQQLQQYYKFDDYPEIEVDKDSQLLKSNIRKQYNTIDYSNNTRTSKSCLANNNISEKMSRKFGQKNQHVRFSQIHSTLQN